MKNSSPPCLIWPEELDSVTVRFPIGALLMTLPVSTEDALEPQAAMKIRTAKRPNARMYLDMISPSDEIETNAHHTETRNSAASNCGTATRRHTAALESLDQKSEMSNVSGI